MKKIFYCGILATMMGAGITSCTNNEDDAVLVDNNSELKVSVGINDIQSRAGIRETAFSGNESLGVFIFRGEEDATNKPIDNVANGARDYNIGGFTGDKVENRSTVNVKYTHDGAGNWTAEKPIILSSVKGTVYSYYPYAEANTEARTVAINVAKDQGKGQTTGKGADLANVNNQYDYMWSTPVSGLSNIFDDAPLVMNHALAQITFKFTRTTYPGAGEITSITLRNKAKNPANPTDLYEAVRTGDATMHIGTGAIDNTSSTNQDGIVIAPVNVTRTNTATSEQYKTLADLTETVVQTAGDPALGFKEVDYYSPRMLVYPSAANIAAGEAEFVIVMDGEAYTLPVPAQYMVDGVATNYKWTAGYNYVYNFNLEGHAFGEDIEVSITQWKGVDIEGGDLETPDSHTTNM